MKVFSLSRFKVDESNMSLILAIISVMISIIPMAALYFAVNDQAKDTLTNTLSRDLEEKSFLIKKSVERYYRQRMIDVKNLSQADVLETNNLPEIAQYLDEIAHNSPSFVDIEIATLDGQILYNSSSLNEKGRSIYEHYTQFKKLINEAISSKQGKVFISPLTLLDSGKLGNLLVSPVTDDSNTKVIKLLIVEASLEPIKILLDEINDVETEFKNRVSLIDNHGLVMASSDDSFEQNKIFPILSFDQSLLAKIQVQNSRRGSLIFFDDKHKQPTTAI